MRNILLTVLLLSSVYTYSQDLDKPIQSTTLHKAKVSNSVQNIKTEKAPYYMNEITRNRKLEKELDSLYFEIVSNNTKIEEALSIIYKRYRGYVTLYFVSNKTSISPSSSIILDSWAKFLLYYQNMELLIYGHTDNCLDQQKSLKLSEDRVNAVKFYLLAKGVDENQLNIKAYGSERPIASNKTKIGRDLNNRVEISCKKK
ncbi:OmpA family protein [Capnocytophaga gingivalis]|jgi:ompA family protein|nr:OmpA family protein [Capnocytophaga gingivalis]RKW18977.1 MAG: OmpA family protein [Capnocytophaga sp.]